jgi:hypothetical protein
MLIEPNVFKITAISKHVLTLNTTWQQLEKTDQNDMRLFWGSGLYETVLGVRTT